MTIILVNYVGASGLVASLFALFLFVVIDIIPELKHVWSKLFILLLLAVAALVLIGSLAPEAVFVKEPSILQSLSGEGASLAGILFSAYFMIVTGLALETYKIRQWDELRRFFIITSMLMFAIGLISLRVFGSILIISLI